LPLGYTVEDASGSMQRGRRPFA